MKLTGAQIVTEILMEQGVKDVFGYPGGTVLNLFDALYDKQQEIRFYLTAHEQGATHAADGYARATGRTGVVIATSGPGATNTVTGIATAFLDSVPMVIITANVGRSMIGRDSFQEVHITGITMPITKFNRMVKRVEDLPSALRSAFNLAQSGRKGPVLIDIPKDLLLMETEFSPLEPIREMPGMEAGEEELAQAAAMLNAAKRPLVLFGGGVISANASDTLKAFLQAGNLPAAGTMMGTGALEREDPAYLGMPGMHGSLCANRAVAEADVVLAVGMRFSDRVAQRAEDYAPRARIIQVDVDQSEIRKNVRADLGLVGDAGAVLKALCPLLEPKPREDWWQAIGELRGREYRPKPTGKGLAPQALMERISTLAGEDAIIATDVGQHQLWAAQYLYGLKPRHFLTSGGFGTMGFGYGAAIGAKTAFPERTVVHITGDGSFHMNMVEACTAVTYGKKIITVIVNNRGLGMVRQWQDMFLGQRRMATEPDRHTDYLTVGRGFGVDTYSVENIEDFEAAFRAALAAKGSSWIECRVAPEERVLPMIPNGETVEHVITD